MEIKKNFFEMYLFLSLKYDNNKIKFLNILNYINIWL